MSEPERSTRDRVGQVLDGLWGLGTQLGRLIGGPRDVELTSADGGWCVVARLPGVAPEEVAVEITNGDLRIRARSEAEVNADHGMPGTGSVKRAFEYQVRLPAGVDAEHVDAVMDHGLLTITLPRGTPGRRSITVGRPYASPRKTANQRRTTIDEATPVRAPTTSAGIDPARDREMHHPNAAEAEVPWKEGT